LPKAKTGEPGDSDDSEEEEEQQRISTKGKARKDKKWGNLGNKKKGGFKVKDRAWIQRKKERQRKQGVKVKNDSKYSGRKRPASFN